MANGLNSFQTQHKTYLNFVRQRVNVLMELYNFVYHSFLF